MKNKLKGFAKDSLLYAIGDGVGKLTNLMLLPILSRIFIPADYGIIDFLTVSYGFLLVLATLNLTTGLQKYYYLKSGAEKKIIVSSIIFYLCFGGSILSLIIVVFANNISYILFNTFVYNNAIIAIAFCLPIELFFSLSLLLLRLKRKTIIFSIYNTMRAVLTTLLTFIFVVSWKTGIPGIFYAKFVSLMILSIGLIIILRNEFILKVNFQVLKNIFVYSWPGHPALIIKSFMDLLPRLVLAYYSTFSVLGIFGIASRISQILEMCIISIKNAWNPFAFSNFGKSDEKLIYQNVFKFFTAIIIFIGMFISLFAKEILQVLTPKEYHLASMFVGGICLYLGFRGLVLIFTPALYSVNKVKITSYLNLILIVLFIISSHIFVPKYHLTGLLVSLNISIIFYFLCYYFFTMKYFRFSIPVARLLTIFFLSVSIVFIFNQYPMPLTKAIFFKTITIILYLTLNYHILLSNKEKIIIHEKYFIPFKKSFLLYVDRSR